MAARDWRPTASVQTLARRAEILGQIRAFFAERGVLEVETPSLSRATVTDPHLHSFVTRFTPPGAKSTEPLYLQTSPEYAMKRLLAAGAGSIYQICRAFRDQEAGGRHNPEFTMLEWYRPGFDHQDLMREVAALLLSILGQRPIVELSYRQAFEPLGVDPHICSTSELAACAGDRLAVGVDARDRESILAFLLTHDIEPTFDSSAITFLFDFPERQAALARLRSEVVAGQTVRVGERFECYVGSERGPIELANGFHELRDATEQRARFERDLEDRKAAGLPEPAIDETFLAALEDGLPSCAGVALGIDRLVMATLGARTLEEVIAFPIGRA